MTDVATNLKLPPSGAPLPHSVCALPFSPTAPEALSEAQKKVYLAPQITLMWWKFKRHRLALASGIFLLILYASILICEFLAPYNFQSRHVDFIRSPPQRVHLFHEGTFVGPFVYGTKYELDMNALRRTYTEDRTRVEPIRFFCRGDPYMFWGLIKGDRHLFCPAEGGTLFLLGTDRLGRDMLSRMIYGARISLTIGLIGITVSFTLGIIIGGLAGYYGGTFDLIVQRVIEIINQVQRAYWDLVFSIRNEQIARDSVELTRVQLQNNQKMVEAGALPPIDLRATEAALESRKGDVITALQSITTSENTLKGLLIKDANDKLWDAQIEPTDQPQSDQPTISLTEASQLALTNRPELDQMRLEAEQKQIDIKFFENQTKPQVDLVGFYSNTGLAGTPSDVVSGGGGFDSVTQGLLTNLNFVLNDLGRDPFNPVPRQVQRRLLPRAEQSVQPGFPHISIRRQVELSVAQSNCGGQSWPNACGSAAA